MSKEVDCVDEFRAGIVRDFDRFPGEVRREQGASYKHAHVIINPASGPDRPILNTLNTVFHETGVNWAVHVTKKLGDAGHYAQQATEAGADVVAAYGGDGTVMEGASALAGSSVPMAIFRRDR